MRFLLVALITVAFVQNAGADTIAITGGTFTFSGADANFFHPAGGRLIGAGFDLELGVRNSFPDCAFGCAAGSSVTVDALLVNELARGNVVIGNGPPDVFASFNRVESFHFTGSPVDIPFTTDPEVTVTGSFDFEGLMPIFISVMPEPPADVLFDLHGSGIFALTLRQTSPDVFVLSSERFEFRPRRRSGTHPARHASRWRCDRARSPPPPLDRP